MLISIKIDLATTITICSRPRGLLARATKGMAGEKARLTTVITPQGAHLKKERDSISVVSRRSLHHTATRSRRRLAQRRPSPDRAQALLAEGTAPPHRRSKHAR
jgi:hypothetical protein